MGGYTVIHGDNDFDVVLCRFFDDFGIDPIAFFDPEELCPDPAWREAHKEWRADLEELGDDCSDCQKSKIIKQYKERLRRIPLTSAPKKDLKNENNPMNLFE